MIRRYYIDRTLKPTLNSPQGKPGTSDKAVFLQVMQTGEPVYGLERAIRRPDGTWGIVSCNAAALRDAIGAVEGMVVSFTDITHRKRTEVALRESEERFRQVFENDLTGLAITTPTGTILACNPSYARLFGFDFIEDALSSN